MNCNVFDANIIKRSICFLIHRQLLQLIQGLQTINNSAKKTQKGWKLSSNNDSNFTVELSQNTLQLSITRQGLCKQII